MADPIENFNYVEGVNLDDSSFSAQQILDQQAIVRQYLEDRYQRLDYSPVSGLHDTVIRPSAQMQLIARSFIEEFSKSRTLFDSLNSTGNEKIVDAILSNFLISRRVGLKSTGTLRISVESASINQNIALSSTFTTSSGIVFSPVSNVSASLLQTRTDGTTIFESTPGGSGYFLVDVVASQSGTEYNIGKNTQFTASSSIDGLISIVSVDSFIGGIDNESNRSVYNRIISSLSARNMTSSLAIDQAIRDKFPKTIFTSTHGASSKYMKRNSHNIFGVKSGCACDVYVKNSTSPARKQIVTVASKIKPEDDFGNLHPGKFLVTIKKDAFPGHYDVLSVKPYSIDKTIGSYEVLSKVRKLTDLSVQNDLHTASEAAFSVYSSTDVIFSEFPESGLDEISVMCEVTGMEELASIQDFANSGGEQSALIDTLIKACVPCFVSIGPISVKVSGDSNVSDHDIIKVVSEYVLGVDTVNDDIRGDAIVSKILSIRGVVGVDLPIRINASIVVPSEKYETISISSLSFLTIPSVPEKFVGPETVGIFIEPDGITVRITKVL